jgi:hypothetical protein
MFYQFFWRPRTPGEALVRWGGMILVIGLFLLLVRLVMHLAEVAWIIAGVGAAMLLIGLLWRDVSRRR